VAGQVITHFDEVVDVHGHFGCASLHRQSDSTSTSTFYRLVLLLGFPPFGMSWHDAVLDTQDEVVMLSQAQRCLIASVTNHE
jgi:hypothetical protein